MATETIVLERDVLQGANDLEEKNEEDKIKWAADETVLFLQLCAQHNSEFMKTTRPKSIFTKISDQMRLKGFNRSHTQLTNRWKVLTRSYKLCASEGRHFEFFDLLDPIMKEREKSGSQPEADVRAKNPVEVTAEPVSNKRKQEDDVPQLRVRVIELIQNVHKELENLANEERRREQERIDEANKFKNEILLLINSVIKKS